MQWKSPERLAIFALFAGAAGIGFAPIFVRLSEVGPSATAFYRLFFALPFLAWATLRENSAVGTSRPPSDLGTTPIPSRSLWFCAVAGLLFASDLAFWHWSIRLTSVANSTLLTNCAPFFVMLGARTVFGERITLPLVMGLCIASVGAAMLVGTSFQLTPRHLLGDILALITASFYGGYLLTIKFLRGSFSTVRVLAWTGAVSSLLLLCIAILSREVIWPHTARGWSILVALALISHLGGQGLIAYALAHLPAGFSSVGLLLQPVVAAFLAWLILAESLSRWQLIGGTIILLGIGVASRRQGDPAPPFSNAAAESGAAVPLNRSDRVG